MPIRCAAAHTSALQARRRTGQVISLLSRNWRNYGTELYWHGVVIACHKRDEAQRTLISLQSEPSVTQLVRQILIVCGPHDVQTVLGWGSAWPKLLQGLNRLDSVEIETPPDLAAAVFGGHSPTSVQLPTLSHLSVDTANWGDPLPLPPPLPAPSFQQLERLHFDGIYAPGTDEEEFLELLLSIVDLSTLRHLDVTIARLDRLFFRSLSKCANLQTLRCCTLPSLNEVGFKRFIRVLGSIGVDTLLHLVLDFTCVGKSRPPLVGVDELTRLFNVISMHSALKTVAIGVDLLEHHAALEMFLASLKAAKLVKFSYITWEVARLERLRVQYASRTEPGEEGGGARWEREEDGVDV
ncbi:hypothetical protein JCM1841_004279 [Sporobolomyces salmonicolor]